MGDGDMRVSMSNLVQMDRHQTDFHRGPMVSQEQTADATRDEAARRLASPAEPDKPEGKTIDPRDKREEERRKKRNTRSLPESEETGSADEPGGCLTHIDFEA
jgi:hypothetical protein